MFAIGDKKWPGISKLVEECGEVLQICGKLMGSRGDTKHWNIADLKLALQDEIGDLRAACHFVTEFCGLDRDYIDQRTKHKVGMFVNWHYGDQEK